MFVVALFVVCFVGSVLAIDREQFCSSEACTKDLIPHCMTDGSVVKGCVGLKKAICQQGKEENEDWDTRYACRDETFCDSEVCTMDYIAHCMDDGSIVHGCSELKTAECENNLKEQNGWTPDRACVPAGYCDSPICTADYIPHCMTDGTTVHGCNELKQAICQQNKRENKDWTPEAACTPQVEPY